MNRTTHEHEPADAELVRRAQRGAPAAFAELVSRYQDRVYNTCYRMCHNQADALDLTQATFLRALESLGQYEARSSFYTWLFRIAVNLTISERRARQRRPAAALEQADPEGAGGGPAGRAAEVSDRLEQCELRARVERALAQLDEEFRAAVILKDIEDMDYASIAEVLDVPVGTVKSRIHRGRLMLRELLKDERNSVGAARTRHA